MEPIEEDADEEVGARGRAARSGGWRRRATSSGRSAGCWTARAMPWRTRCGGSPARCRRRRGIHRRRGCHCTSGRRSGSDWNGATASPPSRRARAGRVTVSREVTATAAGTAIGRRGAPGGLRAGSAAEDPEAGRPAVWPGRSRSGSGGAGRRRRSPTVADRVPGRPGDAGEPRDDLPVAVRAGPRRATPGAGPMPAHRDATAARPRGRRRTARPDPRHGQHLRTAAPRSPTGPCPATGKATSSSGEGSRSAVGTLVERTTRFVLLLHLAETARAAVNVEAAMRKAIATLPAELRRSITWDQGSGDGQPRAVHDRDRDHRSTSVTRTARGSEARTRTPTGCCASTCPRAPTSPSAHRRRPPPRSRAASTTVLARPSDYMTPSEATRRSLRPPPEPATDQVVPCSWQATSWPSLCVQMLRREEHPPRP